MRTRMPRRLLALLVVGPAIGWTVPGASHAQTARVAVERENLRPAPDGNVLAELFEGTPLVPGAVRGRWIEVTLEGWIWSASVREEAAAGHDLVVAVPGGENLRASPNGDRIARARTGMRLNRVETRGDWIRVRRTGWIWRPSLALETPEPAGTPEPTGPPAGDPAAPAAGRPATADTAPPRPAGAAGVTAGGREFLAAGPSGLVLLDGPAGDTLARVRAGGSVEVLAREGDRVRVRVEGWAVAGTLRAGDDTDAAVLRDVSVVALQEDADRVRGRLVEWTVQFIALQRAERYRTDFLEGEPFILARGPGDEAGFVYVAIPPEREADVRRLDPLERVRVLGRVRTARSALTGAPVIDLLELSTPP